MCETPFAHENSRMTFDFVYVKNGQFADLNSLNLGFLKSRASEYVFWENFFGVFYFLRSKFGGFDICSLIVVYGG